MGLGFGYPICCVLAFAFDRGLSGTKRGVHYSRDGEDFWVPCGLFHKTHRNGEELSRATAFRYAPTMVRLQALLMEQPRLHITKAGNLFYKLSDDSEWEQFV